MKATIELRGQLFDSRAALCERYGISLMTLHRWKERGLLPAPVRIGKANFYCREELEAHLAASTCPS